MPKFAQNLALACGLIACMSTANAHADDDAPGKPIVPPQPTVADPANAKPLAKESESNSTTEKSVKSNSKSTDANKVPAGYCHDCYHRGILHRLNGHGVHGHSAYGGKKVYFPELAHLRYLKSHRGGTAEYTHQWNQYHAMQRPWHGGYAHSRWGAPVALIVPPTATNQTRWSWGVGQTTSHPIYHQFGRAHAGTYVEGMPFRQTPYWPSNTDQFGVYPVRGPW